MFTVLLNTDVLIEILKKSIEFLNDFIHKKEVGLGIIVVIALIALIAIFYPLFSKKSKGDLEKLTVDNVGIDDDEYKTTIILSAKKFTLPKNAKKFKFRNNVLFWEKKNDKEEWELFAGKILIATNYSNYKIFENQLFVESRQDGEYWFVPFDKEWEDLSLNSPV